MIGVQENCCDRCGAEMPALQEALFDAEQICLECVMSQRIATMLKSLPADSAGAWQALAPVEQSILRAARLTYDRTGTLSDALYRSLEKLWLKYH